MEKDLSMLFDLYEATMANGLLAQDRGDTVAYFDMFFRRVPDDGGFAIMAGLDQLIGYLRDLTFSEQDVAYLDSLHLFSGRFLDMLRKFRFRCDVWAVPEGTPIFPGEPIVTVRGPVFQCMLIETMLLLTINHQSLIATKANRIVRAADGRSVMEFGARRAQGAAASVLGARAAFIGGCSSTSCVLAAQQFDIPPAGTMAHSWVQMFQSEYEAFEAYAKTYPQNCLLLVDTYNTLKSGLPNAIRVFDEVLAPMGYRPAGIRIDSGDITYLTRRARRMLDDAGYADCKICVSNALDEYLIRDMLIQGAEVDSFGVGERLITASSESVFGGVYKLAAVEDEQGMILPKIKISENTAKITTPCFKKVWRLFDRQTNKAIADVVTLYDEVIDSGAPYELFHPQDTWKRKTVRDFTAKPLLEQIFDQGRQIYQPPSVKQVQRYCAEQVGTLWDEVQRFEKPHTYYVDLSERLWVEKQILLEKLSRF